MMVLLSSSGIILPSKGALIRALVTNYLQLHELSKLAEHLLRSLKKPGVELIFLGVEWS
jgi:hypothetical protein